MQDMKQESTMTSMVGKDIGEGGGEMMAGRERVFYTSQMSMTVMACMHRQQRHGTDTGVAFLFLHVNCVC